MRFTTEQRFSRSVDEVARAYADPGLYERFRGLSKLTDPEVVHHSIDGDRVRLEVRYRFAGDLSPAARAVVDPARLTWIERSVHDLARRSVTFTLVPDHYGDRFSCDGSYRFEEDGGGCVRRGEGDLRVRALLVAKAVEGAIVSGLREHLDEEVPVVEGYLAGSST